MSRGNGYSTTPVISADGRRVAFPSLASDLVRGDRNGVSNVFVKDLRMGVVRSASHGGDGPSFNPPALSADGRLVVFASLASNLVRRDTNNVDDVFVKDLRSGSVTRLDERFGKQGNNFSVAPTISAGGWSVVFSALATNVSAATPTPSSELLLHNRV